MRRAAILVSLLGLFIGVTASAQTPEEYWKREPWKTCLTRSDAAIAACTTIIEGGSTTTPMDLARAYTVRGQAYQRQNKIGHALQDFDAALRIDPRQVEGYASRGFLELEGLGQDDGALRDFDHALSLRPDFTPALIGRSRLFFRQGEFARSIHDADIVLKIDPQSPRGYARRCWGRVAIDELEAAIADCTESLRLWPTFIEALNGRATAYLKLGESDKAAADYDASIHIRAKAPFALYGRGVARRKSGDREGSEADIALAKRLLPDIEQRFKHPWQLDQ